MSAAPQGFVPVAVTERVAPTASEGTLAWTPVMVPAAARSLLTKKGVNRNAAINLMRTDRSKVHAVPAQPCPARDQACWARAPRVLLSISCWVRKILHHSLCSATGIPHSTQTRIRGLASRFLENSFWMMLICSGFPCRPIRRQPSACSDRGSGPRFRPPWRRPARGPVRGPSGAGRAAHRSPAASPPPRGQSGYRGRCSRACARSCGRSLPRTACAAPRRAARGDHAREQEAGKVRRGSGGRKGDDGAEPQRACARRRGRGHGVARAVGEITRLAPAIVGVDDLLGGPADPLHHATALVVERTRVVVLLVLADDAIAERATSIGELPVDALPLEVVGVAP